MMKYPDCPDNRTDCRFQELGGSTTAMYSPIEYDRDGKPVGGGMNTRTRGVHCTKCNNNWTECRTELEAAQEVWPLWVIHSKN